VIILDPQFLIESFTLIPLNFYNKMCISRALLHYFSCLRTFCNFPPNSQISLTLLLYFAFIVTQLFFVPIFIKHHSTSHSHFMYFGCSLAYILGNYLSIFSLLSHFFPCNRPKSDNIKRFNSFIYPCCYSTFERLNVLFLVRYH